MAQNIFKIYDGRNSFWQWDTDQKLIVLDETIDTVYFSNKDMSHSIPSDVYIDIDGKRVCDIPNVLLTIPKNLVASACDNDISPSNVTRIVKFAVRARPIPGNYVVIQPSQSAGVEQFNTLEAAEQWALDSKKSGAIITVNIDSNWTACVIGKDYSVIPVCDQEYVLESINNLNNLVGDVKVQTLVENHNLETRKYVDKALSEFAVSSVAYVAQDTAPEDTSVLWVDINDNEDIIGNVDLTGYATEEWVQESYQPKGEYLTEVPDGYAKIEDIPTKAEDIGAQPAGDYLTEVPSDYATKDFVTDKIDEVDLSGYALKTEIPSVPVQSVNGKIGAVNLSAADVGAITTVNGMAPDDDGNVEIDIGSGCSVTVDDETMMVSSGSASSGGTAENEVLCVTITGNETDGYTADKTADEIYDVFVAKKFVFCHLSSIDGVLSLPLVASYRGLAIFSGGDTDGNVALTISNSYGVEILSCNFLRDTEADKMKTWAENMVDEKLEDFVPGSGWNSNYNPVVKTDDMTQPVGVDADGKLWVAPIGGSTGVSGSIPLTMPKTTFYDEWQYGIGDNTVARYQCWMPNNLQYDKIRNRFIFVQCHRASHNGAFSNATMHILNLADPLMREDIAIPDIAAIANFVIDGSKYYLYPKNTSAVRYVSDDGGATWTSEALNINLQHAFGIYLCNDAFYAGCDYAWDEYHYSADGINWEVRNFGFTDANGDQTKEHSFCYWKGELYAFGRRDFGASGLNTSMTDGSVPGYAVVLKLVGDTWVSVNEDSILAFQSNTHPVPFDDKIALVSINRLSVKASLNMYEFDGENATLVKQWDDLIMDGTQGGFTTPCIAYGDGYTIIGFSGVGGDYTWAANMALFGKYEQDKPMISSYGSIKEQYFTHIGYALNQGTLSTLPVEGINSLEVSSLAVKNNADYDMLVIRNDYKWHDMTHIYGKNYITLNGKMGKIDVPSTGFGKMPFVYKNKPFAIPVANAYTGKPMILNGVFTPNENITIDVSSLQNGEGAYLAEAGQVLSSNGGTSRYFELSVLDSDTESQPETEAYTLPVATPEVLGGVMPVAKTEAMTQEVGVDAEGRLFTIPAPTVTPDTGNGDSGNTGNTGSTGNTMVKKVYEKTIETETSQLSVTLNFAKQPTKICVIGRAVETSGTAAGRGNIAFYTDGVRLFDMNIVGMVGASGSPVYSKTIAQIDGGIIRTAYAVNANQELFKWCTQTNTNDSWFFNPDNVNEVTSFVLMAWGLTAGTIEIWTDGDAVVS